MQNNTIQAPASLANISTLIDTLPMLPKSSSNFELDLLHQVYGVDIEIAVCPKKVAEHLGILVLENDTLTKESKCYFSTSNIIIEYKKTTLPFKDTITIAKHIGHILLHLRECTKMSFSYENGSENNHQEHRVMNNTSYHLMDKTENYYKKQALLFAGKLLIPRGALAEMFERLEKGERYLVSDLCKVFNVSNDLLTKMLHHYNMWDSANIYDNLEYRGSHLKQVI